VSDKKNEKARRRGVVQCPDISKLVGDNSSITIDEFLRSAPYIERYDSSNRPKSNSFSINTYERAGGPGATCPSESRRSTPAFPANPTAEH
jgi:hypothetical protein